MILLYKGKSLISKAIKWQTFGPYSHAAWWMRDGSVVESWHKGGVSHNETPGTIHTPGTVIDVFDFDRPELIDLIEVERFLLDQVGKRYDFRPVLSGFILRLQRDNPDKWFCSELVHAACCMGGLPLLSRVPDFKIHPTLLSYSPRLIKLGEIITTDHERYTFQPLETPDSNRQSEIGNRQCP